MLVGPAFLGLLVPLAPVRRHVDGQPLSAGDPAGGGSCDARWWTVSAFAERQVLVEGWSYDYTWTSSGTDDLEPYRDPALLRANDGSFADPDAPGCRVLAAQGVDWL